jgi:biotin transport system substrate-specific component
MNRTSETLLSVRQPALSATLLRAGLVAVGASLLIAIAARIQVPMWPVPMTLQSMAVLALGLGLGARLATTAVSLYLLQGAMGLPVFAGGGGIGHFFGPTGGFLAGFLAMAWIAGSMADRGWSRSVPSALAAALAGTAALYVFGLTWLAGLVGLQAAIASGMVPFLLGDVIKVALVALALPAAWRLLEKRG